MLVTFFFADFLSSFFFFIPCLFSVTEAVIEKLRGPESLISYEDGGRMEKLRKDDCKFVGSTCGYSVLPLRPTKKKYIDKSNKIVLNAIC